MIRRNLLIAAALSTLLLPLAARAETLQLVGGGFAFLHAPLGLTAPLDTTIHVTSESFEGCLLTPFRKAPYKKRGPSFPGNGRPVKGAEIEFQGVGKASGNIYPVPIEGVLADFTGSFIWETADGNLCGTFIVFDFPSKDNFIFESRIYITFEGGTDRFLNAEGEAYAEGFDMPFGGLCDSGLCDSGLCDSGGVVAEIVSGELRLNP